MDKADDLSRVVGVAKAKQLIEGFADKNLMSKAYKEGSLSTKAASTWLRNNKEVLNKYGLYDKYSKIIKTQGISDKALLNLNTYEKAVTSKVLEADVGKVIKSWFGGSGKIKSAATMRELINLPGIKGNTSAENGVKSAFKDYLMKEARMNVDYSIGFSEDTFKLLTRQASQRGKVLSDNLPAMKVLYTPQQIKALQDYNKLLNMLARNKKVVATAGSPTAEKLIAPESFKSKSVIEAAKSVIQLGAVKAGKGWFVSSWMRLMGVLTRIPKNISNKQIDTMLIEGAFNPETAEMFMNTIKKYKGKHPLAKDFRSHMMTLGIYSGVRTGNIAQESLKDY